MQTICILSYQRTGSSWLCDILSGENTICIQEVFSKDPLLFSHTVSPLLHKIYKMDSNLLETFRKIYQPSNFFIDPATYIVIKNNILKTNPYSINLLYSIQDILYANNYNFVFKIFPEHIEDMDLTSILNIADYVIINYRNDMLNSFISEQKAVVSQRWTSLQKERPYLYKIHWDEVKYLEYTEKVINIMNFWLSNVIREYVLISYEEIHSSIDKNITIINQIKNIYKNFNFDLKQQSCLQKENNNINIVDNFTNPKDFIKSIHNGIRTKIYE